MSPAPLLALLFVATAPSPLVAPTVSRLEDGLELVHARQPGAEQASFRFVVRTGSAADPEGKAGLAHYLEHLIFHGSFDVGEREFANRVHGAGGSYNAFTSTDWTMYTLECPKSAVAELVPLYMKLITSPALNRIRSSRELSVIETETDYAPGGEGLAALIDASVFPAAARGSRVLGSTASRGSITQADLLAFYSSHYTARNSTVVVVADLPEAEVRAMLEGASRLAPDLEPEPQPPVPVLPSLPVSQKSWAPMTLTVAGYHIPGPVDVLRCRELASVLDLRLRIAVHVTEPLVSDVGVFCTRARGSQFILAVAYTRSFDASLLLETIESTFAAAATAAPTPKERALISGRFAGTTARLSADATALADVIAAEAAVPRSRGSTDLKELSSPPALDWARLRAMAGGLTQNRQVLIHFSPFEQY